MVMKLGILFEGMERLVQLSCYKFIKDSAPGNHSNINSSKNYKASFEACVIVQPKE
jgi:hypothetical protein